MSAFGGLILTNKGRALQAKAQIGTQLQYTRIAVGDGSLSGQSITELNDLINQVKSLTITKFKTLADGKATVGAILTNVGLLTGFYWREIGVFATDPDVGEILYCYGNSGSNAEYIPADGGPDIVEKNVDVVTIVGNASNVSAVIDTSLIFASQADMARVEAEIGDVSTLATTSKEIVSAINEVNANKLNSSSYTAADVLTKIKTVDGSGSGLDADLLDGQQASAFATAAQGTKADNAVPTTDYVKAPGYGVTTGSANTYAVTLNPVPSAYTEGMGVEIKVNVSNTGASTINVNSLGAKSILNSKGAALTAGKLTLNSIVTLRYNGTNFILQGESATGTATASDLISGKTADTDAGLITGIIVDKVGSGTVITPSTVDQAIPTGRYGGAVGDGKVLAVANAIPSNILKDVVIAGVTGNVVAFSATTDKKFAKFTGLSASAGIITITGLTFQPKTIIAQNQATYQCISVFSNDLAHTCNIMVYNNSGVAGNCTPNASGCAIQVQASSNAWDVILIG